MNRKQVFDRLNDHTNHCVSCKTTLKNIKIFQLLLPTLLLIHGIHNNNMVDLIGAISSYFILEKLTEFFIYRDYIHNEV